MQREIRSISSDEFLQAMSNFNAMADKKGRLQFIGRKEVLGYSQDELIGKPFWSCEWFSHSAEVARHVKKAIKAACQGRTTRMEISVISKKKNEISIYYSTSPMLDKKGKLLGIALEGVGINELKEKEEAIRRERKAFNILAAAAAYTVNTTDLCKRILTGLVETLGFDFGAIRLYNNQTNMLQPSISIGLNKKLQAKTSHSIDVKNAECVAAFVGRTRRPVFTPDVRKDEIYNLFKDRFVEFDCRSHISWPLIDEDAKLLGVMQLSTHTSKKISENERLFFETVARMFVLVLKREQAREQIEASLKEKRLLLKEIHHRVKNNLQIISSLLNLQAGYLDNQHYKDMFDESRDRIKSMALIHEQLYFSNDLANINFNEYIKTLTNSLLRSYQTQNKKISLKINKEPVFLGINQAIPCGLIINEIVTNAFKHAFQKTDRGEIRINFNEKDSGEFMLAISDDGQGFPKEIDFAKTKSLGLQIVNLLIKQIGGNLEIDHRRGTTFKIYFPKD